MLISEAQGDPFDYNVRNDWNIFLFELEVGCPYKRGKKGVKKEIVFSQGHLYITFKKDLLTISAISGSRNGTISMISGSRNLLVHFQDFLINKW